MGFDKASLVVEHVPVARRLGQLLQEVASPAIEVGPGASGLPAVREEPLGEGPLVALCSGHAALSAKEPAAAALVLACDMPLVDAVLLRLLADWPGRGSVVPVVRGHVQPLCARWSSADLRLAAELVRAGERSMRALVARAGVVLLEEQEWSEAVEERCFFDVDTPADLAALGLRWSRVAPTPQRAQPT
jgi:molybdopterin-guanine dinucleotide biosynthesis protein A